MDVIIHEAKSVDRESVLLHKKLKAVDYDFLHRVIGQQMLPLQAGDGDEIRMFLRLNHSN
jgi:hypothetical protein